MRRIEEPNPRSRPPSPWAGHGVRCWGDLAEKEISPALVAVLASPAHHEELRIEAGSCGAKHTEGRALGNGHPFSVEVQAVDALRGLWAGPSAPRRRAPTTPVTARIVP